MTWYFLNTANDFDPGNPADYNSAPDGSGSVPGSFSAGDLLIANGYELVGNTDPGAAVTLRCNTFGSGTFPANFTIVFQAGGTWGSSITVEGNIEVQASTGSGTGTINGTVTIDAGVTFSGGSFSLAMSINGGVTLAWNASVCGNIGGTVTTPDGVQSIGSGSFMSVVSGSGPTGYPAAQYVLAGQSTNGSPGTLILPTAAQVESGVTYGIAGSGSTGTYAGTVPAASDVRYGVSVGDTTGTCYVPTAANVRSGTSVDATTGTLAVPTPTKVLTGTSTDNTTGSLTLPTAGNVLSSAGAYGVAGTGSTPTLTLPSGSNVLSGSGTYGVGGTAVTPSLTLPGTAYVLSPTSGGPASWGVGGDASVGTASGAPPPLSSTVTASGYVYSGLSPAPGAKVCYRLIVPPRNGSSSGDPGPMVLGYTLTKAGEPYDATSVSIPGGIIRTDTGAFVVAPGANNYTLVSTGVYQFSFTQPAPGLTYQFTRIVVVDGQTLSATLTKTAPMPRSQSGSGCFDGTTKTATADGTGYVTLPLWKQSEYELWFGNGEHMRVVTGNANCSIPELLSGAR